MSSNNQNSNRSLGIGILVMALICAPLFLVIFFLPPKWQVTGIVAAVGILLVAGAYALGRARSRTLAPFHPKERLVFLGANTLGNQYGVAALMLLGLSLLVIFLPGQLGKKDPGQNRKPPPAKVVKNPIQEVEIPYGIPTDVDDRRWTGFINTNKRAIAGVESQKPSPPGFRWVLYYLTVTPLTDKAEFYAASTSIKLLDDKGKLYLPDYGAGILNAEQSYVRQDTRSFWTPAYLVPVGAKPERLQVEIYPGIEKLLIFRPQTRLDFCQQFEKARVLDIAAKRKPKPLPKDCPAVLAKEKARIAQDSAKTTPNPAPRAPSSKG